MIFFFLYLISCSTSFIKCDLQVGPDPWDYNNKDTIDYKEVPPDLQPIAVKKITINNNGVGDWYYKRLLALILKGGNVKNNEDGSIDTCIQMRYSQERWRVMEKYILSDAPVSEDMVRRSIGYIEESIYKPTVIEKIAMAWSEYVHFYLIEYKIQLTWLLSFLTLIFSMLWLWNHISHKHVIVMVIVTLYFYEAFVSYKEAEKQELEIFMKAINTCKWYIWSSNCEVPPPDLLIFLKHMNPLKIAVRLFTTLISEPMLIINETIKIMINGITDELWYPFNKITYGLLILIFNALLIFLLILIMFNYILNIPFSLNFLFINVGLKQRRRTFINNNDNEPSPPPIENVDRVSERTLTKILDVCSRALNTAQTAQVGTASTSMNPMICDSQNKSGLKRSASTGRLPSTSTYRDTRLHNIQIKNIHNGGGDAWLKDK